MTSLAEDAYVGTLHYKLLDPPISVGGGVQNPMDTNLDGGGFNITNVNALTTGTLNYTTLNPPLPTSGVANPMIVNLDGGNFNITNVNALKSATLESTGKIQSDLEIISLGKLEGANGLVSGNWEVGGNFEVDSAGTSELKGPTELKGATTDVLNFRDVSYKAPAVYGTKAVPIVITIGGAGTALSFDMLGDNRSVLIYGVPSGQGQGVQFDIFTDIADVLDHYVVEVNLVHIVVDTLNYSVEGLEITPNLITGAPDNKKFNVRIEGSKQAQAGDVYKIAVRLIKTD